MPQARNPRTIGGHSYHVQDRTAIESTRVFYEGLIRGKSLSKIMADVRGLSLVDPFTFFNLVHYRLEGAADCSWVTEPKKLTNTRGPGPMLIGRESELGAVTKSVLPRELTTGVPHPGATGSPLIHACTVL